MTKYLMCIYWGHICIFIPNMKFLSWILWLGGLCTDADGTDNYAWWTNHDYTGSFGKIPNQPIKTLSYWSGTFSCIMSQWYLPCLPELIFFFSFHFDILCHVERQCWVQKLISKLLCQAGHWSLIKVSSDAKKWSLNTGKICTFGH